MALPVKLQDVIEAMDTPADGWMAYINRRTGEIVTFSEDEVVFRDDDDGLILPDWQAEFVAKAKEIEASDEFVQLPDKFDIHEYSIMERFCHGVDDDTVRQDFWTPLEEAVPLAVSRA